MLAQRQQAGRGLPGSFAGRIVSWQAARIADPVEKLRFLRQSTRLLQSRGPVGRSAADVAAAVILLGLAPISITRATGVWNQPRKMSSLESAAFGKLPVSPSKVWLVEKKEDFEVYSNGLRIETKGAEFHSARKYQPLERARLEKWNLDGALDVGWRTDPVGIVFHTTESDLAPFDPSQNGKLQRLAKGVLSFVRHNKSYHYLIDRFGRVFRVVEESSSANHAGHSIWADRNSVYVNLNHSFLGISFEAQTRPQDGTETINEAQMHAGRVLTDMLRVKYGIAPENCATHAQVSVNPENFRIGAHTDWASHFPFAEMGLPDNYAVPVPSMAIFGFTYDSSYVSVSEARLWKGLLLAQEEVRQAASAQGLKLPTYRTVLHRRYQELIEARKAQKKEDSL